MPTIAQMLAKAEELEALARSIRQAAATFNGDLRETKQARGGQVLAQAIALRHEQKGTRSPEKAQEMQQRETLIRAFLAGGPQSRRAIVDHLAAHDFPVAKDALGRQLHAMGLVTEGSTQNATWRLPDQAPRPKKWTPEAKARSAEKARVLATILKDAGRAMQSDELAQAARAAGFTGPLTGIWNYVKQGYLTVSGKKPHLRYRFKAMPPGAEDMHE